jgi:hypothetical protein
MYHSVRANVPLRQANECTTPLGTTNTQVLDHERLRASSGCDSYAYALESYGSLGRYGPEVTTRLSPRWSLYFSISDASAIARLQKGIPLHRTIQTTPSRSRQLALAAAFLGMPDSESVIQSFIFAGLRSLAEHDATFKLALLRSADVDWDTLQRIAEESSEDSS